MLVILLFGFFGLSCELGSWEPPLVYVHFSVYCSTFSLAKLKRLSISYARRLHFVLYIGVWISALNGCVPPPTRREARVLGRTGSYVIILSLCRTSATRTRSALPSIRYGVLLSNVHGDGDFVACTRTHAFTVSLFVLCVAFHALASWTSFDRVHRRSDTGVGRKGEEVLENFLFVGFHPSRSLSSCRRHRTYRCYVWCGVSNNFLLGFHFRLVSFLISCVSSIRCHSFIHLFISFIRCVILRAFRC